MGYAGPTWRRREYAREIDQQKEGIKDGHVCFRHSIFCLGWPCLPACCSSAFGLELTNLLCTGCCCQREGRGRERGVVSVRKMA